MPCRQSSLPWRDLRSGRRIGVDVGTVRVGIAVSDPEGLLAFPLATLSFTDSRAVAAEIVALVVEHEAIEVIVGLPRHLSGEQGKSAGFARDVASAVSALGPAVRLVDERLTTASAAASLRANGRTARQQREVIDQEAARVILQFALDSERATGRVPGELP